MAWGSPVILREAAAPLTVLFLQLLRSARGGCSQVSCQRLSPRLGCLSSTYKASLTSLVINQLFDWRVAALFKSCGALRPAGPGGSTTVTPPKSSTIQAVCGHDV